jgi:hypothetical protein
MLTRPRSARNGARRFARSVLALPRTPSIGRVALSRHRRDGRRLEADGDVLARIGFPKAVGQTTLISIQPPQDA